MLRLTFSSLGLHGVPGVTAEIRSIFTASGAAGCLTALEWAISAMTERPRVVVSAANPRDRSNLRGYSGNPYLEKLGRLNMARLNAESQALQELALLTPET